MTGDITRGRARLTRDWMLRGWTDVPAALVNWSTTACLHLPSAALYVAEHCDGETNFDSMAFLPMHRAALDALIQQGVVEDCRAGDSIESWQRYRKAPNPFVRRIHWAITGRCNLSCRHCFMESSSGKYGQLSFSVMLEIIEQLARANVIQVSLTGGEPLIRGDFLQILTSLKDHRIGVNEIFSNGLLVTDKLLTHLSAIGVAPTFQISFDGVGFHDRMRGRANVERRVVDAIRLLRSVGMEVIVATNVDRVSVACLDATYELMRGLEVNAWRVGTPLALGNWTASAGSLSLEEQDRCFAPIVKRWREDDRPFEIVMGLFFRARGRKTAPTSGAADPHTPDSFDCASVRLEPHLLPDGTLVPCPGYVGTRIEGAMPNLLERSFSDVWTQSLVRSVADLRKEKVLRANPECASCKLFGRCGAGCRASSMRETGDLMARDPIACKLWRGRYRDRFLQLALC